MELGRGRRSTGSRSAQRGETSVATLLVVGAGSWGGLRAERRAAGSWGESATDDLSVIAGVCRDDEVSVDRRFHVDDLFFRCTTFHCVLPGSIVSGSLFSVLLFCEGSGAFSVILLM